MKNHFLLKFNSNYVKNFYPKDNCIKKKKGILMVYCFSHTAEHIVVEQKQKERNISYLFCEPAY